MPNLVDQIFEQAQLGTARNPDANPFGQGLQMGQEQQRINLAQRQQQAELAQLPLKLTVMKQQADIQGLQIEQQLRARDNYINATHAFNQLSADVSQLVQDGKLDEARQTATARALSNNSLLADPRFENLDKSLDAMQRRKTDLAYKQALGQARLSAADAANLRALKGSAQAKFFEQQAIANGDDVLADYWHKQGDLEFDREQRLQQQANTAAEHNRIRMQQMEANIRNSGNKFALQAFKSQADAIVNAPKLKPEEQQAKIGQLLDEYEAKYRTAEPPPSNTPLPAVPSANVVLPGTTNAPPKRFKWTPNGLVPAE